MPSNTTAARGDDARWAGDLTLTPGMVVYMGPGGPSDPHSHNAVQLFWSFDEPMTLETEQGALVGQAVLMPKSIEHRLEYEGDRLLAAFFEPLGPRGSELDALARQHLGSTIEPLLPDPGSVAAEDPVTLVGLVLDALLPGQARAPEVSAHVTAAIDYMETAIDGRPLLDEAARAANISPSRLTHLFTEEMGIPFRRFILWMRLRRAVEAVAAGANLTEAAIEAGFSDSSHLSRVFRETFGLNPSALLGMKVRSADWPG